MSSSYECVEGMHRTLDAIDRSTPSFLYATLLFIAIYHATHACVRRASYEHMRSDNSTIEMAICPKIIMLTIGKIVEPLSICSQSTR